MAIQNQKPKIENELHIWRWRHENPPPDDSVLIDRERERAARFRIESARRRFAGTRAALRHVLARYVEHVKIIGEDGKPKLASGEIDFNVTHTSGISLIAIAPAGSDVGIDVEPLRRVERAETIARRFFTADEVSEVLGSNDRDRAFLRCWTRKEALVKARGGAMWDLIEKRREPEDTSGWTILELDVGDAFIATATLRAGNYTIKLLEA